MACRDGWGAAVSENGQEEIDQGWGCVGENNNNMKRKMNPWQCGEQRENNNNNKKKGKVTKWEHAGHLDNFVPVGNNNNSPQKGKGISSSTSRGGRPNNEPRRWERKREFNDNNNEGGGGGGWKGKRDFNDGGNEGGGWKGKRVSNDGCGWNNNGGRTPSNGNGGSQVSSGGNRFGRVQTLGDRPQRRRFDRVGRVQTLDNNNFRGLSGHRVSLHFPVQSPQLQKILREDLCFPAPRNEFQGHFNEPRSPPRQVNEPRPPGRQVNGPPPPPTPPSPPLVNALQVYQPPVQQERVAGKKVRVTHAPGGSWIMEVEEFI